MADKTDKQKDAPQDPERAAKFTWSDSSDVEWIDRDDPRSKPSPDSRLEVPSFEESLRRLARDNRRTRIEGSESDGD